MNAGWKLSTGIFALSLAAHGGLMLIRGIGATPDFWSSYDPLAVRVVSCLHGSAAGLPAILEPYDFFHVNYALFVSAVYLAFGIGNLPALIGLQVLLSSGVSLILFHFLKRQYDSTAVAAGATVFGFAFFDSMYMTIVGSPESLYRSLLVTAVLVLFLLHERRRRAAFMASALIFFAVLLGIRIDTLVLFAPVYALGFTGLVDRRGGWRPSPAVLSTVILALLFCVSLAVKLYAGDNPIARLDRKYFEEGIVVADLGPEGRIEALEPGLRQGVLEVLQRSLRLFVLRANQFFTVAPPSWSSAHQTYYALHMVPLYLLALVGVVRAWRSRNAFFGLAVQCYLAAIVLHGLTRVDAAHRTLFTSFIFLIMLSGYGFDALWGRVRCRWRP